MMPESMIALSIPTGSAAERMRAPTAPELPVRSTFGDTVTIGRLLPFDRARGRGSPLIRLVRH